MEERIILKFKMSIETLLH